MSYSTYVPGGGGGGHFHYNVYRIREEKKSREKGDTVFLRGRRAYREQGVKNMNNRKKGNLNRNDFMWKGYVSQGIGYRITDYIVGGHPNRRITRFSVKFSIMRFSIISIVDIPYNILWNSQFLIRCNFCVIITFIESCHSILS